MEKSEKTKQFVLDGLHQSSTKKLLSKNLPEDLGDLILPADPYIFMVEIWKRELTLFGKKWSSEHRQSRIDELSIWFADQFQLIKEGKEAILTKDPVNENSTKFARRDLDWILFDLD